MDLTGPLLSISPHTHGRVLSVPLDAEHPLSGSVVARRRRQRRAARRRRAARGSLVVRRVDALVEAVCTGRATGWR